MRKNKGADQANPSQHIVLEATIDPPFEWCFAGRPMLAHFLILTGIHYVLPSQLLHEKNKGADQTAHLCSLISTFVICSLDLTIYN